MAGADTQSAQYGYSGLPKSIKVVNYIAQGPGVAGTWSAISYGGVTMGQGGTYNYGGFTWTGGGNPNQILIPEAGIYKFDAAFAINNLCDEVFLGWQLVRNGVSAGVPTVMLGMGHCAGIHFAARGLWSGTHEFISGDLLNPLWFCVGVAAGFPADGSNWFSVTKIGGAY